MRQIAGVLTRSSPFLDLVQASRNVARLCQSSASRKYKAELRKQGVLEQLISLADDVDGGQSQSREEMYLQDVVFRL